MNWWQVLRGSADWRITSKLPANQLSTLISSDPVWTSAEINVPMTSSNVGCKLQRLPIYGSLKDAPTPLNKFKTQKGKVSSIFTPQRFLGDGYFQGKYDFFLKHLNVEKLQVIIWEGTAFTGCKLLLNMFIRIWT